MSMLLTKTVIVINQSGLHDGFLYDGRFPFSYLNKQYPKEISRCHMIIISDLYVLLSVT